MILVTGATGHLGTAAVNHLLKICGKNEFAVMARNEEKAKHFILQGIEVRYATYNDINDLEKAFNGIDKLFFISSGEQNREELHKNVIDTAEKAGIRHIAYTSVKMRDIEQAALKDLMYENILTENYIQSKGFSYTFLRDSIYFDMIPSYVGKNVFEIGQAIIPAGKGRVAYALRREMGEAAANVLTQDGHENKMYNITGSELYSFSDIVKVLTEISGKQVVYNDIPEDDFADLLRKIGLPEFEMYIATSFARDIKDGQFEFVYPDLEMLLGRKPSGLRESLKEIYNF